MSAAGVRRVDAGIAPECFDEAATLLAALDRSPENHPVGFLRERNFVVQPDVQTTAVQIEQYRVVSFVGTISPPRSIFRALMIVG